MRYCPQEPATYAPDDTRFALPADRPVSEEAPLSGGEALSLHALPAASTGSTPHQYLGRQFGDPRFTLGTAQPVEQQVNSLLTDVVGSYPATGGGFPADRKIGDINAFFFIDRRTDLV